VEEIIDPDDDVLQVACALAATPRQGKLDTSTARESFSALEYQNCLSFVSILGQVVSGQHEVNHAVHTDCPLPNTIAGIPLTRLDYEMSGLDEDDTTYLLGKDVFTMPPHSIWYSTHSTTTGSSMLTHE